MSPIVNTSGRRSGRAFGALVLAAILTISSFARAEQVLCFGEDGHVVLEAALSGECADALPENGCTDSTTHFDVHPADDCGPCEDIAVGDDLVPHAAKRSAHTVDAPAALSTSSVPVIDIIFNAARNITRGALPFTVPPIFIRSVSSLR
jgi:hypothetical protein